MGYTVKEPGPCKLCPNNGFRYMFWVSISTHFYPYSPILANFEKLVTYVTIFDHLVCFDIFLPVETNIYTFGPTFTQFVKRK